MAEESGIRISLGESAYRRLRDEIITCRLAPGQRLTEKQLAADTGFGVSPIREALTRLDHDGLVRTLPRRGYQVTSLTPKIVDDLFDTWTFIGAELVRRAVTNATVEQLAEIAGGFQLPGVVVREEAGSGDDLQDRARRFVASYEATFRHLAEATGNEYIVTMFDRLSGDMARVWIMVLSADPDAVNVGRRALSWSECLANRDADTAAELTRAYVAEIRERMLAVLARWPSVMASEVVPIAPG